MKILKLKFKVDDFSSYTEKEIKTFCDYLLFNCYLMYNIHDMHGLKSTQEYIKNNFKWYNKVDCNKEGNPALQNCIYKEYKVDKYEVIDKMLEILIFLDNKYRLDNFSLNEHLSNIIQILAINNQCKNTPKDKIAVKFLSKLEEYSCECLTK